MLDIKNSLCTKASEIVKSKLIENAGTAKVTLINGKQYDITMTSDGKSFKTSALPIKPPYEFSVFDVIVELLILNDGKAYKGTGRNAKLGEAKCEFDTVVGTIGKNYAGKNMGDSIYDPVFVLAAILDWADICRNCRGYIEFTPNFRMQLAH
jgi:hypothetical protein